MEILARTELDYRKEEIINKIINGAIFIYPTDTIYGIGCNAIKEKSVAKIRKIKKREKSPFSIIIPSINWVKENCFIAPNAQKWIARLPGPFTVILPLNNSVAVAKNVTPSLDSIGIRLPDHWISKLVNECGIPIVTTSANKTGQKFMTSIEDLDPDVEKEVEFMIYEGPKEARPSKIIDIEKEEVKER
jgi:L-threonylcarbamoyladenylate synthase